MFSLPHLPLYGAVVIASLLSLGFFKTPFSAVIKLCVNSILGFLALCVFNFFGSYAGLYIGINLFNSLIIGALGPFGLILIIVLCFVL